jgi:hexosaminidase
MRLIQAILSVGIIILIFSCKEPVSKPVVRIIPQPAQVIDQRGIFSISGDTKIRINRENEQLEQIASFLNNHIDKYFGFTTKILTSSSQGNNSIFLKLDESLKIGKEDYHLTVLSDGVVVEAAALNGLFYGVQTLTQLMPPTIKPLKEIIIPAIEINDTPRFGWRGLQLDVSRNFMPKEFMLKYLDAMAMHKLNTLHWHLADDQGWRIEIKKYPLLTEVGSVRKKTIKGHINNSLGTDTIPSGGFYSQLDIREIVQYASERYITIIPEIGMPGHSLAALAAYPELGCTANPYEVASRWNLYSDIYCPGKEGTFTFISDVMGEMSSLFPGKYFHIGGAETIETRWDQCPDCQNRMKSDSLYTTKALHNYFENRVSKIVKSLGKQSVHWEINLNDTLDGEAVTVAWHGEKETMAVTKKRLQTVVSTAKYFNFDQYQTDPKTEPLAVGGMLTLEQVYNIEPIPATVSKQDSRYIIGMQANIWTAYMKTPVHVEYMTFPRAAAFAEVAWSPKASHNYKWFKKRLLVQAKRYEAEGINFCKAEFKH